METSEQGADSKRSHCQYTPLQRRRHLQTGMERESSHGENLRARFFNRVSTMQNSTWIDADRRRKSVASQGQSPGAMLVGGSQYHKLSRNVHIRTVLKNVISVTDYIFVNAEGAVQTPYKPSGFWPVCFFPPTLSCALLAPLEAVSWAPAMPISKLGFLAPAGRTHPLVLTTGRITRVLAQSRDSAASAVTSPAELFNDHHQHGNDKTLTSTESIR